VNIGEEVNVQGLAATTPVVMTRPSREVTSMWEYPRLYLQGKWGKLGQGHSSLSMFCLRMCMEDRLCIQLLG